MKTEHTEDGVSVLAKLSALRPGWAWGIKHIRVIRAPKEPGHFTDVRIEWREP